MNLIDLTTNFFHNSNSKLKKIMRYQTAQRNSCRKTQMLQKDIIKLIQANKGKHSISEVAMNNQIEREIYGLLDKKSQKESKQRIIERTKINMLQKMCIKQIYQDLKDIILLKGFTIGENRYQVDIDLLARSDFSKTGEKLENLGFMKMGYDHKNKEHYHHLSYGKKYDSYTVHIELHHQIEQRNSPFKFNISSKDIVKDKIGNLNIKRLDNEALLIHICTHTSYDHMYVTGIKGLIDIKKYLDERHVDWNKIVSKSKEWGCETYVYHVLNLSKELLNAKVPGYIIKQLEQCVNKKDLLFLNYIKKNIVTTRNVKILNIERWILRLFFSKNLKQAWNILIDGLSIRF